ncbi:unnamed protein product [Hydatigera taeniaeformis]|uniref:Uncharacterized protein n=1 Tax=Hydatigena taeniaeformis TaxID=6205 RepID=A0A0R3XA75_HYDTA|nr:unnamed protein product [Hydatigera taeniaeformis]
MSHLLASPDITPPPSPIHPPHTFQCHMLSSSLPPSLPPSPPPPPQAPHARITTNSTSTLASPHIRWSQSDDKPHTPHHLRYHHLFQPPTPLGRVTKSSLPLCYLDPRVSDEWRWSLAPSSSPPLAFLPPDAFIGQEWCPWPGG